MYSMYYFFFFGIFSKNILAEHYLNLAGVLPQQLAQSLVTQPQQITSQQSTSTANQISSTIDNSVDSNKDQNKLKDFLWKVKSKYAELTENRQKPDNMQISIHFFKEKFCSHMFIGGYPRGQMSRFVFLTFGSSLETSAMTAPLKMENIEITFLIIV